MQTHIVQKESTTANKQVGGGTVSMATKGRKELLERYRTESADTSEGTKKTTFVAV